MTGLNYTSIHTSDALMPSTRYPKFKPKFSFDKTVNDFKCDDNYRNNSQLISIALGYISGIILQFIVSEHS